VHILVVPKEHVASLSDITPENSQVAAKCLEAVAKIVKELKLSSGYRVIVNTGENAGQTVFHLHFHILGGEHLPAMLTRGRA